jgi:hypothetical protein
VKRDDFPWHEEFEEPLVPPSFGLSERCETSAG